MRVLLCLSITILFCFEYCYSFKPEIIFYKGTNQTGDGIIIRSKRADVMPLSEEIFWNAASYCAKGHHYFYDGLNFNGRWVSIEDMGDITCRERTTIPIRSVRFLGPEDTEIESISFYKNIFCSDEEVTITTSSFENLPFPPMSIFSTGLSNWTLFSGENFDGTSLCYVPSREADQLNLNTTLAENIKSVEKGCSSHVHTYLYAKVVQGQVQPQQTLEA